jgi:hypothetical protein
LRVTRWPYTFSLDDLEVQGCIFQGAMAEPLLDAGDRVPGVRVRHRPTGATATMTVHPTRDENLQTALWRLDRVLRGAAAKRADDSLRRES